ncbi:hypothetical protein NEDG_01317 [Nematocida displodere]|uniref:EF-hand domain-containing protein n=1 Tax=Nematocida displodere TaxID=1805483 RepID=A0A177EBC0_9MICR|nr:hypothetical protein NEDG_01317 [Nematocida displodere]
MEQPGPDTQHDKDTKLPRHYESTPKKLFFMGILGGVLLCFGCLGLFMCTTEALNREKRAPAGAFVFLCFILLAAFVLAFLLVSVKINKCYKTFANLPTAYALKQNKHLLCASVSGIILSSVVKLIVCFCLVYNHPGEQRGLPVVFTETTRVFKMVVEIVSITAGVFALKGLFISYTGYLLHRTSGRGDVRYTRDVISIIDKLDMFVEKETTSVKEKSQIIFCAIAGPRAEMLVFSDLLSRLSEEDASQLMMLFDTDLDAEITKSEFESGYANIQNEKEKLQRTTRKKERIVANLDSFLFIICAVFAFIFVVYFVDTRMFQGGDKSPPIDSPLVGIFFGLTTLMVSTMAIHGQIFSTLVASISHIFFVRPFDIGDIISFESAYYKVHSFGLIHSVYKTGEKYVVIPNSYIMNKPVENLSKSLFYHGSFPVVIRAKDLQKAVGELKKALEAFFSGNKKFKKPFYLGEFASTQENTLSATIQYALTCTYKDRPVIAEREDELKLYIFDKLSNLAEGANGEKAGAQIETIPISSLQSQSQGHQVS